MERGGGGGGARAVPRINFVCVVARARALGSIKQFYAYMLPTVQAHRCPTRRGPVGTGQSMEVAAVVFSRWSPKRCTEPRQLLA